MKFKQITAGLILASFAVFNVAFAMPVKAVAVDNDPDCDKYSVMYCGVFSNNAIVNKYQNGDGQNSAANIQSIFSNMGVSKAEVQAGGYVDGIVFQNGTITVNGKVVATNAKTYIRTMGNVSTSKMGSAQTAYVKLNKDGVFQYAIMKPCGNPVSATPTKPPTPSKKPAFDCVSLSARAINVKKREFGYTVTYVAKDGATLKSANFNFGDGQKKNDVSAANINKVTHTFAKEGTYTTTVTVFFNTKDGVVSDSCSVKIKAMPDVCPTNPTVPVGSPECNPTTPPVTPPEIPNTGAGSTIALFIGSVLVSAAAYRLWMIRKLS